MSPAIAFPCSSARLPSGQLAMAQEAHEPGAPPELHRRDLAVGHQAERTDFAATGDHARQARHEPTECVQRGETVASPAGEDADDDLDDRDHDELQQNDRRPPPTGEGGDGSHPMARRETAVGEVRTSLDEFGPMTSTSSRDDEDTSPAEVRPPAQVEAVAVEVDVGRETTERAEQVGSDQQTGRRQGEHVPDGVVLLLVDLAGLEDGIGFAEPVDGHADLLEHLGARPSRPASARRSRRSTGTAPRPGGSRRRVRGRRRRAGNRTIRCPRPAASPRRRRVRTPGSRRRCARGHRGSPRRCDRRCRRHSRSRGTAGAGSGSPGHGVLTRTSANHVAGLVDHHDRDHGRGGGAGYVHGASRLLARSGSGAFPSTEVLAIVSTFRYAASSRAPGTPGRHPDTEEPS